MKKTVLVLITFALVIAVAGSGFWLVHYFIDSRERRTYETLAEEFVLESTPTPESTTPAEIVHPLKIPDEPAESVSLTTAPLATTQPWRRKMRIVWGGLPFPTRESIIPSCTRRMTRSTTCAGISTVIPPAVEPFLGWSEPGRSRKSEPYLLRSQHDGRLHVQAL